MENKSFYQYWGKASREDGSYHLLPYHCLDVAAVGYALLNYDHVYLNHFLRLTGFDKSQFINWFTFLLALHDIGKFADSFQNLNPGVLRILQQRNSQREYGLRHDSLGLLLWKNHLRQKFQEKGLIPQAGGSKRRRVAELPIDYWMAAMVGHHGQPPQPITTRLLSDDFEEPLDFEAAEAFADDLGFLFQNGTTVFPDCDKQAIQLASWWLSGLAVLCDWLGSNIDFFPYMSQPMRLADYWKLAKEKAAKAIRATEISSSQSSIMLELADLMPKVQDHTPEPTPLQSKIAQWQITDSPHLFILEDVTGAGKTEAALLLAHRLMQGGLGNSLYFALPTMATANTMYLRMSQVYRKLFAGEALPSLVLAHGASDMSEEFKQSVFPETPATADSYGDGTVPAGAHCNAWLADNRKKALLADIGIGTVDQVLLAVMPARHQSLRLLGLMNKILLVDEVHACDAYMNELLCTLLRAHATAGGSVILLSATLPKQQRQALLDAYAQGHRWSKSLLQATDENSYPLVSCLNVEGLQEEVVATRDSVRREVNIEFFSVRESIDALLADVVERGQCVCWIRNTVKDAIEAYQHIKEQYPDWHVDLFHARYALGDRIDIEKRIVNRFDKDSRSESRSGQVLIATQVVEQSLDLDFDTLITDLAPIDLIIQRAGRLRRHIRDKVGNPVFSAQDQRGEVTLHIYSPAMTDRPAARWYAEFFPNAQKVYRHHGQLWLTANLLYRRGKFRMPEDARLLIESVYGDDEQANIPETLLHQSNEAEGADRADASIARLNALTIEVGYSDLSTNRWWDEAKAPTRLGEQTTMVYLAKWQNGVLQPWIFEKKYAWQLSAVSMRTYWITSEATTAEITTELIENCKADLPAKGKWGVLLPLRYTVDDVWEGWALNDRNEKIRFIYTDRLGLMVDSKS